MLFGIKSCNSVTFRKSLLRRFLEGKRITDRRTFHSNKCLQAPVLSQQSIDIVKSTAPVLAEHGYTITTTMYKKMLQDPKIAEMFNPAHQIEIGEKKAQQPFSLACSVHAYAANIDNLGALKEAVELIANKHVSLAIKAEHYEPVGENLIWAIKEVLGDAATPEVLNAWGEAYWFLADILINRETELRETIASHPGGWEYWREFVVEKKVEESEEIQSIYLKPKDGKPLPDYPAGSYCAIRLEVPGEQTTQRNYTLSKASDDTNTFRFSIKRQPALIEGCPVGRVSNYVHDKLSAGDILKVGVPCGNFVLKTPKDEKEAIVLLSGGVGLTPVIAMLEQLIKDKVKNNIFVVVSAKSPETEAMHDVLAKYRRKHLNLFIKTIYDSDPSGQYPEGPFKMEYLEAMIPHEAIKTNAQYYFCGPTPYMKVIYKGLVQDWKIPKDNVNFEFFGPIGELE